MRIIFMLLVLAIAHSDLSAQLLQFQDAGLKSFLVSENCMSSDPLALPDLNIDLNNDQEISHEEALAVDHLNLADYGGQYQILSLADLGHFENLESLSITLLGNSSNNILSFTGFSFDALTHLSISDCYPMDSIDVSSLPDLTTLDVIGLTELTYLNVQNGSEANMSLFYTQDIAYACVDSIADEYNQVSSAMVIGSSPSLDCRVTSVLELDNGSTITFYPNPTDGLLEWVSKTPVNQLYIYDNLGRLVSAYLGSYSEVDISYLENGWYTLMVTAGDRQSFTSIIKR